MRAASSWLLVPAMGLAGVGDDAGTEGEERAGSGEGEEGEAAAVVLGGRGEAAATVESGTNSMRGTSLKTK